MKISHYFGKAQQNKHRGDISLQVRYLLNNNVKNTMPGLDTVENVPIGTSISQIVQDKFNGFRERLIPGVGTQAVVVVELVNLVVHELEEEEHVVVLPLVLLTQHYLVVIH